MAFLFFLLIVLRLGRGPLGQDRPLSDARRQRRRD